MTGERPLYIHIGLQKTGTSYLQSIFWQNVEELTAQGLDMVPGSKRATFHLMLRARDRYQPDVDPPGVAGALDRLPQQLAEAPGTRALITEESFAPAPDGQIERLLAACTGREVHLVVTLRDLGRQIPSAWQQLIQSGGYIAWDDYLDAMKACEGDVPSKYWRSTDVAAILERWARHVPAERIHVVTVPPPGADPEILLHRFCEVLGVDWTRLDRSLPARNRGIGRVQAEVLRRVNYRLPEADRRRDVYGEVGKRWFAVKVLGPQNGDRIRIPSEYADWVRDLSTRYSAAIRAAGHPVTGDLTDLDPVPSSFTDAGFEVTEQEVFAAATNALASILSERAAELRVRRAAAVEAAPAPDPAPGRVRRLFARR
ncbi:hypothetical protein [Nocardioides jiangxiensis]|uniref:Sulfotransferase family protein n=1 Tax=Nocardioides jiangxiensis TaxID=3064524 RepID=A0ABT9AY00_9ACTN|nr:hypothetical protein [Nocardioides sp. WY-20]MDO7867454.1 hypothetical protein [Nocardioides sp. WY-20]